MSCYMSLSLDSPSNEIDPEQVVESTIILKFLYLLRAPDELIVYQYLHKHVQSLPTLDFAENRQDHACVQFRIRVGHI